MRPSLLRLAAQSAHPKPYTSPHRAKRLWPPDFSQISAKHQFRLERRYKRRAKLKWARPRWTKFVKIAQMGSIGFVLVYSVLFLDWNTSFQGDPEKVPFEGVRKWFFGLTGGIWSRGREERGDADNRVGTRENKG